MKFIPINMYLSLGLIWILVECSLASGKYDFEKKEYLQKSIDLSLVYSVLFRYLAFYRNIKSMNLNVQQMNQVVKIK